MWSKHPQYVIARKNFSSGFTPWKLTNLHNQIPKVIFICGGSESNCKNRNSIETYFQKHLPKFLTFRAEKAWEVISKDEKENVLALEEWLADFSDVIIILVESFGTAAELGAFALSSPLREKLLPILDISYKDDESFINTGPIRWVDNDSKFGPSIYTHFDTILTCIPDVEKRISRRTIESLSSSRTFGEFNFSKKVMLFFLVYLISALGPITLKEIVGITNDTIRYKDKKDINFILSVGVALNIFKVTKSSDFEFFSCVDYEKLFKESSTKAFLHSIQASRARSLSSLLAISDYRDVLNEVVQNAT